MNATTRRYIYGIATAALPLLIAAGVLTEHLVPSVLALLGAVLVPGLAAKNTPSDDG